METMFRIDISILAILKVKTGPVRQTLQSVFNPFHTLHSYADTKSLVSVSFARQGKPNCRMNSQTAVAGPHPVMYFFHGPATLFNPKLSGSLAAYWIKNLKFISNIFFKNANVTPEKATLFHLFMLGAEPMGKALFSFNKTITDYSR